MKTLITSLLFLFVLSSALYADSAGVKAGLYDFTDEATRDFFKFGFTVQGDYSFYSTPYAQLNILLGVCYSTVEYNGKRHNNFIFPFQLSFITNLLDERPDRPVIPFCGAGVGMYYKRDTAQTLDKDYKTLTYGYHYLLGFSYKMGDKTDFTCELKNNIITTHYLEEIVISGINLLFGIRYRI